MLVTDAGATTLTKLGAPRHAETPRSGDCETGSSPLLGPVAREQPRAYTYTNPDALCIDDASVSRLLSRWVVAACYRGG